MGALASGGARVLNDELVAALDIPASTIEAVVVQEQRELTRRAPLTLAAIGLPATARSRLATGNAGRRVPGMP